MHLLCIKAQKLCERGTIPDIHLHMRKLRRSAVRGLPQTSLSLKVELGLKPGTLPLGPWLSWRAGLQAPRCFRRSFHLGPLGRGALSLTLPCCLAGLRDLTRLSQVL